MNTVVRDKSEGKLGSKQAQATFSVQAMAEQATSRLYIRKYDPKDEKQVRFIIGQAQMEILAYVNHRGM